MTDMQVLAEPDLADTQTLSSEEEPPRPAPLPASTAPLELGVDEIVFRKDLYPRIEQSDRRVDQYAADLDVLPPIEVNQHRELIDGWHRWTAHRRAEAERIRVTVTETASEAHFLELAIRRNATHGVQLTAEEKRDMARRIYNGTPERDRARKKRELASILSVSDRSVHEWLQRIDKDTKEARDKRIFAMWLACHTQQEIADTEGISQGEVSKSIPNGSFADWNITDGQRATASHATDFAPPIYNIWKQQEKTAGTSHFGNSEVRWVDNLLYLYTQPFDIVVDPFAGSGSTADICRKRFRRYWVSDRKVKPGREDVIRQHDLITADDDGTAVTLPGVPRWKDVRLVYLDPPYWRQAQGEYSNDRADLGNMDLDQFNKALAGIINGLARKLTSAHIALIIQPTQWKAPDRAFTDHVGDMLRMVRLPVVMRISAPYESQQCNPQMVTWAKENKKVLVLTREIVVWQVQK